MILTWNLDHYLSLTGEMRRGQKAPRSRHLWKYAAILIFQILLLQSIAAIRKTYFACMVHNS